MRSDGQFCSIARASIWWEVAGHCRSSANCCCSRGLCRFTDLKNGLPGIATNLLSTRLKDLEDARLIDHGDAPPPIATKLYRLTSDGRALESAIAALGLWGRSSALLKNGPTGDYLEGNRRDSTSTSSLMRRPK